MIINRSNVLIVIIFFLLMAFALVKNQVATNVPSLQLQGMPKLFPLATTQPSTQPATEFVVDDGPVVEVSLTPMVIEDRKMEAQLNALRRHKEFEAAEKAYVSELRRRSPNLAQSSLPALNRNLMRQYENVPDTAPSQSQVALRP